MSTGAATYHDAGVDIGAGDSAAKRYQSHMVASQRAEVFSPFGGFAGGFLPDLSRYSEPMLVSATDGVGTKLLVAIAANDFSTIGQDLVAMCVNDLAVYGADPLFFLDYFATGKLDVDAAEQIVASIARACTACGCSLIGGETAELPGMYKAGEFDLAGFAVGACERKWAQAPVVTEEMSIVGVASSGLHSNGYSLARKVVADARLTLDDVFVGSGLRVGDALLEPTLLYASLARSLRETFEVAAMAHITGGGVFGNLNRVVPAGWVADLDVDSWPVPPVFSDLAHLGSIAHRECFGVFNMGIGFAVFVPHHQTEAVLQLCKQLGHAAYCIGVLRRD